MFPPPTIAGEGGTGMRAKGEDGPIGVLSSAPAASALASPDRARQQEATARGNQRGNAQPFGMIELETSGKGAGAQGGVVRGGLTGGGLGGLAAAAPGEALTQKLAVQVTRSSTPKREAPAPKPEAKRNVPADKEARNDVPNDQERSDKDRKDKQLPAAPLALAAVGHSALPCSAAADLPFEERLLLWRERLSATGGSYRAMALLYDSIQIGR